ncbi:neuronal acetylcholine receptor subunit alpha-7 [Plakobranchus ocellatus]|uniref:Neuronal acetylcholine receptor subunit alpha-7 n=1 Tax=Plakobranchus ocellatus TaxID=259542 RepID=A0AAV3ZRF5_9GAST|nr:neuronal acetylcholine receptor subunit alpha-7 [Plakobranchus ocellatus]
MEAWQVEIGTRGLFYSLMEILTFILAARANFNSSSLLYTRFLTGIDHRIPPSLNTSNPVEVYVEMNLVSLRDIAEREQYCVLNVWLEFVWRDEIRTWDPADYDGVKIIYPDPQGTWKPRVIVANSVEKRDMFADAYSPLAIFWDGTTHWYPGDMLSVSCSLDLTSFPFDSQVCYIHFIAQIFSWHMHLNPARSVFNTADYIPNGEWDLKSSTIRNDTLLPNNIPFDSLYFEMTFRRKAGFYLINVVVPVMLMSFLSPLVFILPEDSGERASYSVTLLLSLSVFMGMVSSKLASQLRSLTCRSQAHLLDASPQWIVCSLHCNSPWLGAKKK